MSHNLLKGKRGIIFGALNDMSIAWKVAEKAVEEGATITLSNTPIAVRMGQVDALAEKLHAEVIPADATSVEDLETVFSKSVEILGKADKSGVIAEKFGVNGVFVVIIGMSGEFALVREIHDISR